MTKREENIKELKEILQVAVDNIEVRSDTDVYSRALKLLVEYAMEHESDNVHAISFQMTPYFPPFNNPPMTCGKSTSINCGNPSCPICTKLLRKEI